jgi:transcriptional regulator with XRE-family HTH domain
LVLSSFRIRGIKSDLSTAHAVTRFVDWLSGAAGGRAAVSVVASGHKALGGVVAGKKREYPRPLRVFGEEVRRYREVAGLSMAELEARSSISDSHIGKIERGETRCSREVAEALDKVLDSRGALPSLWDKLVKDASLPTWFDWPVIEERAGLLVAYENFVVYGLLQTEDYASALLVDPGERAFRLKRQEILTRDEPAPPRLVVLLAESVLTNLVGSPEIMRDQLKHLLEPPSPRTTVQIVPGPVPPSGTSGAFCIATLSDRTEVGYVETPARGFTLAEPADIQTISDNMADVRAAALPVGLSRDLIQRVMEERWT